MEILDIAHVHGWNTASRDLERTAMLGNKELRLAIEDVKTQLSPRIQMYHSPITFRWSPSKEASFVTSSGSSSSRDSERVSPGSSVIHVDSTPSDAKLQP